MIDVGAPTRQEETAIWIEIRQDGKFLMEYDPLHNRIRMRRWGREFILDLDAIAISRTSVLKSKQ